ncbi:MAG: DUF4290 domain-containing protein, partial [Bacteroidales bacterium]|nr:DUF4290 domain-containing protein [Bacteroidales bacterium]
QSGSILQKYIASAAQRPDSPYKDDLLVVLGNHMKKIYQLNNTETFNDDFIIEDMNALSNGKLNLAPGSIRFMQVQKNNGNNNRYTNNKKKNKQR